MGVKLDFGGENKPTSPEAESMDVENIKQAIQAIESGDTDTAIQILKELLTSEESEVEEETAKPKKGSMESDVMEMYAKK